MKAEFDRRVGYYVFTSAGFTSAASGWQREGRMRVDVFDGGVSRAGIEN